MCLQCSLRYIYVLSWPAGANSFELRELLVPLLFVNGSLYGNKVVLLLCHVVRKRYWVILTHLLKCARKKESGELSVRVNSWICAWVWYPQSAHLVIGSMRYHQTIWKDHPVFDLVPMCCGWWLWNPLHWQGFLSCGLFLDFCTKI